MFWLIISLAIIFFFAICRLGRPKQMVNFGGPDDEETCPDCHKALNGSPYPIDKAPIPGKLSCGNKCRHALQLIVPANNPITPSKKKQKDTSINPDVRRFKKAYSTVKSIGKLFK